jgi:hypothetical protein
LNGTVKAMGDFINKILKNFMYVIFGLLIYPREETASIQNAAVF